MTDLETKYQKLAIEYSKIRSQIPVLKKAVIDEQAINEQLKEKVKLKDQSLRKYEQEVDSLTFRNQQLETRVEVLQKELEDLENNANRKHSKKSVHHSNNSITVSHTYPDIQSFTKVLDEELKLKIEENVLLHQKLSEIEGEHARELNDLNEKMETFVLTDNDRETRLKTCRESYEEVIGNLRKDKLVLEKKLQDNEKFVSESDLRSKQLESNLSNLKENLSAKYENCLQIITQKLPFNDTETVAVSLLNLSNFDQSFEKKSESRRLALKWVDYMDKLVTSLSMYYDSFKERVSCEVLEYVAGDGIVVGGDTININLIGLLNDHMTYLEPIKSRVVKMAAILNDRYGYLTLDSMKKFHDSWKTYAGYSNELLVSQMSFLESQSLRNCCPPSLANQNSLLQNVLSANVSAILNLETCLRPVSSLKYDNNNEVSDDNDDNIGGSISSENIPKKFETLSKALFVWKEATKDLLEKYGDKMKQESSLPTTVQTVKNSNLKVYQSIEYLLFAIDQIAKFSSENIPQTSSLFHKTFSYWLEIDQSSELGQYSSTNNSLSLSYLHERAADYMQLTKKPLSRSVPHGEAVENKKFVDHMLKQADKHDLCQQVIYLHERLHRLEEEREQWRLETRLVRTKLEKFLKLQKEETTTIESTAAPNKNGREINRSVVDGNFTGQTKKKYVTELGSSIEEGEELSGFDADHRIDNDREGGTAGRLSTRGGEEVEKVSWFDDEKEATTRIVRYHYRKRLEALFKDLQLAESQAFHFHSECLSLQTKLSLHQQEHGMIRLDLISANQNADQLKDDLQTTTRSYEEQLSLMSDHLASLNETLARQRDEIDLLKYRLEESQQHSSSSQQHQSIFANHQSTSSSTSSSGSNGKAQLLKKGRF